MGYVSGRFDFSVAAPFLAQLVAALEHEPMPPETLINVNCPAGEPRGVEVTKLGKRLYNDELKLVGEEDESGRAATRSTAGSPASRSSREPT